ncbi:DUF4335 domain-containing protein [Crocosphaera sp. Alani8]|uniref:DUF4335 domain-containing protein n=1 Tax=Crocosphaera sp. Alani8 TaxID=3038952 RepID=UPI00313E37C1
MLFNNTPLQVYTPPTCTLKLWDKRPPLSRWGELVSLDSIEFELEFDDPRLLEEDQVTVKGDRNQLELLRNVVQTYVKNFLHQTASYWQTGEAQPTPQTQSPVRKTDRTIPPSLSPQGLLNHRLTFGSLASQASRGSVILSVSQLLDLVNALDSYDDTIVTLTDSKTTPLKKSVGVWMVAGTVAVLAILIPTVGVEWLRQVTSTGTPSEEDSEISDNPLSFLDVSPPVPPPPKTPLPAPSLAPQLANRDPLPPPGQIGQGTPPPRNATVAIQAAPLRVLPPPPAAPPAPPKPNTNPSNTSVTVEQVPQHLLPNGETPIVMPGLPPERVEQLIQNPTLPAPPTLQAKASNTGTTPSLPSLSTRNRDQLTIPDELLSPEAKVTPKPPPETTLLDAIPQVAQVRQYFQQRWQPPEDLEQTLEYRLILQEDGSLKQTIPLGRSAAIYFSRIPFPNPGSEFVSPLEASSSQTIRLVLIPNGRVKTLLE